jgi:hypothetical protein
MKQSEGLTKLSANRRSFLKKGVMGAGAAAMAAGLLPGSLVASAQGEDDGVSITKGDIAILTFLQALEQVEADLWIQYSELGGTQDNEVSGVNEEVRSEGWLSVCRKCAGAGLPEYAPGSKRRALGAAPQFQRAPTLVPSS